MQKLRKMDLIEVCTGLKRSLDRKTGASKERCGLVLQGILGTGEIIVRKVLVYSSIRMGTSTKACGPWIKSTVRVPTGETTQTNLDVSTLGTGLKTKNMVEEPFSLRILTVTMGIGSMECLKAKVE
jgi:hypothetical protein